MSAPLTDLPPSSISSSGLVDGLGRRVLAFDRETGVILERLRLRPELAAFEMPIRQRIEQLAALDDERFARPGAVQREPETGDLTVLSEFVAGSRLSDLIETAEEAALIPGVDVALGFLLEALPAISTFHNVTGFAHGLIDPSRMVITPAAGQVVFLDPTFGAVVERLGLSRTRLWSELGIAAPQSAGPVRLDAVSDIAQIVLSAVMLVIGRRLRESEYPDALPSLLMEVVEVAQIRGSSEFATSLQRLLQRSLPLPGRHPFTSADELITEIRLLLRREIGAEVCRQALLDFTEQMDAASASSRASFEDHEDSYGTGTGPAVFGLDEEALDAVDSFEVLDEDQVESDGESEDDDEESEDQYSEVSLDPDGLNDSGASLTGAPAGEKSSSSSRDSEIGTEEPSSFEATASSDLSATSGPVEVPRQEIDDTQDSQQAPKGEDAVETDAPATDHRAGSRRRKRQHKSARARKDKLRSTARPQAPPPKQPESKPATPSGWLVSPDRATAFAPPIPDPPPAPPAFAASSSPALTPVQPAPMPAPVQMPPRPAVPMPVYGAPMPAAISATVPPAPVIPAPITPPRNPAPAAAGPVRLKSEPPVGYAPPRPKEPVAAIPYMHRGPIVEPEEPRPTFPWKLAVAAVLIVGIAVVVGRSHLRSSTTDEEGGTPVAAKAPSAPLTPPPVTPPKVETGDIAIETQPSGARVLLDGKPVGETPLKLAAVPVGRHVLTFISSSGEVNRTVRVAAGKMLEVDVSIFSGWLAVFAPVVLDVSVNGRSIGTTEQSRLMLPPGRHELTLTNKDLGFKAVQEVSVEPGEVRSVTLEPRGDANFNAIPWAEVWMDGQKLGDTPLANMRVPLGTREFVFKHPQYGEKRVTAIIRADQPTAVSVDFTRSQ